jgi:colanic acid/amylovoran biosynthesis glycosyltransferase
VIELHLLGDGPDRGRLERLTRDRGLEAQVRFHGFQQDVRPHLDAADFYIQPSRWEGLCRGVLEAMAEGLLVVSTDVGGMADYGVDGQNMIKAAGPDRHSLARALERALQLSAHEVSEIGRAAAATVAEKFSGHALKADWRRALQVLSAASAKRRGSVLAGAGAGLRLEPPSSEAAP